MEWNGTYRKWPGQEAIGFVVLDQRWFLNFGSMGRLLNGQEDTTCTWGYNALFLPYFFDSLTKYTTP